MSKANEGSIVPVWQFLKDQSCMNTIYLHPFSFQMSITLLKGKTSITGTQTRIFSGNNGWISSLLLMQGEQTPCWLTVSGTSSGPGSKGCFLHFMKQFVQFHDCTYTLCMFFFSFNTNVNSAWYQGGNPREDLHLFSLVPLRESLVCAPPDSNGSCSKWQAKAQSFPINLQVTMHHDFRMLQQH